MTVVQKRDRSAALPHGVQGAADPHFVCAVRAFSAMFPAPRFGGGALAVYLHGKPVVDVWTGWRDRHGAQHWDADTGAMVFSATKGIASTVIHRLADRALLDYDAPVAEYWREFGANGKSDITIREMMRHRAGLSNLNGVSMADLFDHHAMEARIAAAPPSELRGKPAYHALTYGWLLSGLARAITGEGMRELIRREVAQPLNTDGLHLGRPPASSPTHAAHIIGPQAVLPIPGFNRLAPAIAAHRRSAIFGATYFPGVMASIQGDTPMLDAEMPAANAVATARGLARMYGAIANGGLIDGVQFLSEEIVRGLTGTPSLRFDHTVGIPMSFHLGYHALAIPGVLPGFGHVGLGGSVGWADPQTGMAFGFVHNRLLTPLVLSDHAGFVGTAALIRRAVSKVRERGFEPITGSGAPFDLSEPIAG